MKIKHTIVACILIFTLIIDVNFSLAQGNDPCTATLLTVAPTCALISGTNSGGTNSVVPDATCDGGNSNGDIWYSAIVGANGTLIIRTTPGTLTDIGMAIYTGSSCSALSLNSCIAGGSPGFNNMPYKSLSGMMPGSEVWIRLWDVGNDETGTFNICAQVNCSASVTITGATSGCSAGITQLCATAGFTSYLWNNGTTNSCINVNATGTYTVTVTDADGCTATDSHSFTALASPAVTITGPTSGCSADSPQLCTPAGFTSYAWSNGGVSRCVTANASGAYTVTVTAANGCTASDAHLITINTSPTISVTGPPSKCVGGSEQLCVPSGYSSYLWSNSGTLNCITPNTTGTYTATVTDANGCTASASQLLTVHTPPSIIVSGPTAACPESNPQLCVAGGFSSYSWSNGGSSNCINPSTSGTYTCTVTDGFGCTASDTATITIYPAASVHITGPASACEGSAVQLCVPSGYNNYNWSNGSSDSCTTPATTGNYTVIITDVNGCTGSDNFNFTFNAKPSATISGPTSTCNGASAQLCAPAGNTFYLWSNGNTNSCITATTSGNYSVTVTGSNGCTNTSSLTLTVIPPYAMTISGPTTSCRSSNPQLCASTGNYTYQWSNGATTACIDPTVSGIYTVIATNQNGCTRSASKGLTIYAPLNATVIGPSSACNGSVIPLCGPSGSSSFIWSTGDTTECIDVMNNGVYTVTISDVHGCTASASKAVTFASTFAVDITGPVSGCNGSPSQLCVPAGYSHYTWNTGDTSECIFVDTAGSFSCTVVDQVGCNATDTFNIIFNDPPLVSITGSTIICKNSLANWCATPGFPEYLWSNGGTGACINISIAATYSVTVTDANGCTATDLSPLAVVNISPNIILSNGLLICDTVNPHYTYAWTINGQPTSCSGDSCTPVFSGIYAVNVTDTVLGCSETATYNFILPGVFGIQGDQNISIYPNPFNEEGFNISFINLTSEKIKMEIYNAYGKIILNKTFDVQSDNETKQISIPSPAAGIYYVYIRTDKGVLVKKVLAN
jgi:hypothetical protein